MILHSFAKRFILTCILFVTFAGNAAAGTNITDQVTVKQSTSLNNNYIQSVKIIQDGYTFFVTGKIKFNRNVPGTFDRHVDVSIISPDGKKIYAASVYCTPRLQSVKSSRKAYLRPGFKVGFSGILQEGSTVCVALHNSIKKGTSKTFNCGNIISDSE